MKQASVGSPLRMDCAYVDETAGVALCAWDAPERTSLEALFARAGVRTESVRQVAVYKA